MKRYLIPSSLLVCTSLMAWSQDSLVELEPMTIIGGLENLYELPGSGYALTAEEFRTQNYTNINRMLARVPGVYTRDEDGAGNFPNLSIRGADGTRSEKVTIMEDGILQAPAPYSAPSAYYSPRAGRMSGVEVLKGSSQVKYGPNTTGGVINYLSTEIPDQETFYTRNTFGSNNTFLSHSYYGNSVETKYGKVGYLFEIFHNESDGFRKIDSGFNGAVAGGQNTGYKVTDPMIKLFWEPNSAVKQRFEFKWGRSSLDANESYVGLSESDVRNNPDRRYAATAWDNIDTRQDRTYLKHVIQPNADFRLETAIYQNKFRRNWFKLDDADGAGFGNIRTALLTQAGRDLLQGTAAANGSLTVRNNNRKYEAYGIQTAAEWSFETGEVDHTLSFGARYHSDYVRRRQGDRDITVVNGAITSVVDEVFGQQGNRRQESDAVALWIEDKIELGSLTLSPGLRYERIDQSFQEFGKTPGVDLDQPLTGANDFGSDTIDYLAPGVGFTYSVDSKNQVFGGLYKGFSVPSPRASIRSGVDFEESLGYELGYRARRGALRGEFVAFLTDFDSLFAADAGTGAGGGDLRNAGAATVWGLEALVQYDPMTGKGASFSLPTYVSATYTSAEFDSAVTGAGGAGNDIYVGAAPGNEVPYIPEFKLAAGIGFEAESFGVNLDGTYVSESFGTAQNLSDPADPANTQGARAGKIDELLIFDLSAYYRVNDNVKLVAGMANLFDERGIVSRIPRGPRANEGRTAYLGFEAEF